jgi:ATP-dependent Clp endopeptidase proteolytic subunit ClpP
MIVRKSNSNPKAIELYGTIYGGDGAWLLRDIQSIAPAGDLTVHIHSPGGSVTDGNLILNYIKKRKGKKIAIVDGVAASMAAILLTAFDEVHIASNAFIMVHQPTMSQTGTAKSMEQAAKVLNNMTDQFKTALIAKSGASEETVKEWFTGDTWFTADEALDAGIVDKVVDATLEDSEVTAFYQMDIAAMAETFPKYERPEEGAENNPTAEGSSADNSNKNTKEMKLTAQSLVILALAESATDEEINAKIAELNAKAQEGSTLRTQLEQIHNERIETEVSAAVSAGKITAVQTPRFVELGKKDFDLLKDTLAALPAKANLTQGIKPQNQNGGADDARADWTWADWTKKDTKGLLTMKAEDPERYKALATAANISL